MRELKEVHPRWPHLDGRHHVRLRVAPEKVHAEREDDQHDGGDDDVRVRLLLLDLLDVVPHLAAREPQARGEPAGARTLEELVRAQPRERGARLEVGIETLGLE